MPTRNQQSKPPVNGWFFVSFAWLARLTKSKLDFTANPDFLISGLDLAGLAAAITTGGITIIPGFAIVDDLIAALVHHAGVRAGIVINTIAIIAAFASIDDHVAAPFTG